jgi:hypothetical protein
MGRGEKLFVKTDRRGLHRSEKQIFPQNASGSFSLHLDTRLFTVHTLFAFISSYFKFILPLKLSIQFPLLLLIFLFSLVILHPN